MMAKENQKNTNRGLASASDETRTRVAREGGKAPHDERGLQATDDETRARVAREGGKASHSGGRKRS
jgi:general stress protein YciG